MKLPTKTQTRRSIQRTYLSAVLTWVTSPLWGPTVWIIYNENQQKG